MLEAVSPAKIGGMDAGERGAEIRARRIGHGMKQNVLAKLAGVSRQTLGRAERGEPTVEELTFAQIERALDEFEEETLSDPEWLEAQDNNGGKRLVKIRLSGVYGVAEVVFEGPVEDLDELRRQADLLMRGEFERRNGGANGTQ